MQLAENEDIERYATAFDTIFLEDTDKNYTMISRAMMTIDDYSRCLST